MPLQKFILKLIKSPKSDFNGPAAAITVAAAFNNFRFLSSYSNSLMFVYNNKYQKQLHCTVINQKEYTNFSRENPQKVKSVFTILKY